MSQHLHAQTPVAAPATAITMAYRPLVQRSCACGGSAGPAGECESCQEKKLAAAPTHGGASGAGTPTLRISSPSDAGEKEAERTADAVMRMTDDATPPAIAGGREEVQRQEEDPAPPSAEASQGEENTEENARLMEESNVSPSLEAGAMAPSHAGVPLSRAIARSDGGSPLPPSALGFMERRFGHDFSRVRVHTDEGAHRAARSIRARAFTHGQRIFFARGHYSPETPAGRHLLAHELTHTVQQAGSVAPALVQRSYCPAACSAPVTAGRLCRASSVTRDGCGERDAADASNKISHIRVLLDTDRVHLFWNGSPRTDTGTKEEIDCHANASRTPTGWDEIGVKCGENHTSYQRFNMAYFTAFKSTGYNVGFHDSQPLTGPPSHGCVRVSCENARRINQNTKSGWTSIMVRNSASGD